MSRFSDATWPPPFGVDRRGTVRLWEWTDFVVLHGEVRPPK